MPRVIKFLSPNLKETEENKTEKNKIPTEHMKMIFDSLYTGIHEKANINF